MATNTINIILSLSDEDRARIDALLSNVAPLKTETHTEVDPEIPPTKERQPEKTTQEATPRFTVADIQKKTVALCATGKKPEVREIISSYADRVSQVPADKVDEVMERLMALEG